MAIRHGLYIYNVPTSTVGTKVFGVYADGLALADAKLAAFLAPIKYSPVLVLRVVTAQHSDEVVDLNPDPEV